MTAEPPERFSLSRWSRRKHEAARTATPETAPVAPVAAQTPAVPEPVPPTAATLPEAPLPPVESLTMDSDFTAFLSPKVDETTRRAALRKLFSDPHFNVMDGLDTYIDDYTKSDPMPDGMLEKLASVYKKLTESPVEEAAASAESEAPLAVDELQTPVEEARADDDEDKDKAQT